MGNAKRFAKSLFRKSKRFLKNKKVQNALYTSYHIYNTMRYVRNPFLLLEYVNLFNVARLLKM